MNNKAERSNNLFVDIWNSFRALPTWVQVWIVILLATNFASLFFLNQPRGMLISFLAIFAVLPNLPIMLYDRGFSKVMALPHVIPWTIVVLLILFARPAGSEAYNRYLSVLLVVDAISLVFDYTDSVKWWNGDRAVAR